MLYSIQIGNAAAKNWVQFAYDFKLNRTSNFQVALDGITSEYLNEYDTENEIKIYRSGVLEFRGIITLQKSLIAGGVVLSGLGIEIELTDNKSPMVGSAISRVWNSTSDHTIFSTLITSVTGWDVDVTNSTGSNLASFRTTASESVWNAVISLITQTGKDIYIDQENKKVYLYDELTRESKFSFIEGKNARNITRTKSRSKAGKVIVYGKGDGENQIIGSHGASTPVETVIDRNIISETEANARAVTEYNKLNPNPKSYKLTPIYSNGLRLGDSGQISSNSAKINEEVDLVRIKRVVSNLGKEEISIEVTNPENRQAKKTRADELNKQEANYRQSQSSMQGSGNTLTWAGLINGNNTAPLNLTFNVPSNYIENEAGNIQINSFTLDFDIDKFRSEIGTASEDNVAPDVLNSSGNTAPSVSGSSSNQSAGVSGSSANQSAGVSGTSENQGASEQGYAFSGYNDRIEDDMDGSWNNASTSINLGSSNYLFHGIFASFSIISVMGSGSFSLDVDLYVRAYNSDGGEYYPDSDGIRVLQRMEVDDDVAITTCPSMYIHVPKNWSSENIKLQFKSDNVSSDIERANMTYSYHGSEGHTHGDGSYSGDSHAHSDGTYSGDSHAHSDGTYSADSHGHSDGTYSAESHKHNVVIGDEVSDAENLNASSVDIHLDYWNGSSWDEDKHTILNTNKTLDTDVDLSNGGIYPDNSGYWRVRIYTDNATADLIKSIVKIKHNLEN